jgi:hypothetical protein
MPAPNLPLYSPETRDELREILTKKVIPVTESGCWIWGGTIAQHGYGIVNGYGFGTTDPKRQYAHRVFYILYKGPVPEGMEIDHLCRVRCCVNPDHLEAVTPKVNRLRGESFAAKHARKTHCPYGHPLVPENLVKISTRPWYRGCRECKIKRDSLYYRRRQNALSQVSGISSAESR